MTGKECFGVIVRTVGLGLCLLGGYYMAGSLYVVMTPERTHTMGALAAVASGVGFVLLGLAVMRGASVLVNFSYPAGPPG